MSSPESQPRVAFPGVPGPKPLLSARTERALSARQRELLEELERLVASQSLADLTMAEIARRVNCSLRTLYEISPSREELVLTVVDRRLHRIGREAIGSLDESLSPLGLLRAYLSAASRAVQPESVAFGRDFAGLPGAQRLLDGHENYVMAVTRSLLERAVAEGEIAPVDTAAVAHVLGGLGREFARTDFASGRSAKKTADAMTEIILRGLERA